MNYVGSIMVSFLIGIIYNNCSQMTLGYTGALFFVASRFHLTYLKMGSSEYGFLWLKANRYKSHHSVIGTAFFRNSVTYFAVGQLNTVIIYAIFFTNVSKTYCSTLVF